MDFHGLDLLCSIIHKRRPTATEYTRRSPGKHHRVRVCARVALCEVTMLVPSPCIDTVAVYQRMLGAAREHRTGKLASITGTLKVCVQAAAVDAGRVTSDAYHRAPAAPKCDQVGYHVAAIIGTLKVERHWSQRKYARRLAIPRN